MVEATRYPFAPKSAGLAEGLRGSGSQGFASQIWGISGDEYIQRADVWPLNPKGEILLGLKIEDRQALQNAEESTRVPGIGFAEWGPGDMGWSLGFVGGRQRGGAVPPEMTQARARVLAACKAAKIAFLNAVNENNVEEMIQEGVMVCAGNEAAAARGRKFTKRSMPW
jgi:4-hydroxy-2-oxoheptanedioate aldolase